MEQAQIQIRDLVEKIMSWLAARDHSEKELRAKLIRSYNQAAKRKSFKSFKSIANRDHSHSSSSTSHILLPTEEQIEEALQIIRQQGWLKSSQQLSQDVYQQLSRRKKSHRYIQHYLQTKGLPSVERNLEEETQKALELIRQRLRFEPPFQHLDHTDKQRVARFLSQRGFDSECIRQVLK